MPAVGLGCRNLSRAYGVPPTPEAAERLLLTAVEEGVTLFDTAAPYGFGANEELVGQTLAGHRDRIVLASKCGMTGVDGRRVIDGQPETIRRTADEALARLCTDVIDVYHLHRLDRAVPVEESVGAMAEPVTAGKVRALSLSEVSAATLRRAPCTRSPRYRTSTASERATQRRAHSRPPVNSASPSWCSARWREASSPRRRRTSTPFP
ncbi:aldo/keto reductase [Streptomyces sp. bgisy060]|uniref:aldo/keto reductase n=1 Tax=Streptomyces sp. bgisy060 TaxID=3413775 RepID=UPI003EBC5A25